MFKQKIVAACFCFISVLAPLFPQQTGALSAEGSGTGPNAADAVEAAKIAAVDTLARSVLKRDAVFADLLVSEAFKNDWFESVSKKRTLTGRWEAHATALIDESLLDALYYGRYSTTVGSLLDRAESILAEMEPLLAEGGERESNGDLGGAETAYRRARAKADEALRVVGPVEDAVFFSTAGKRKAPELKAVIGALVGTADSGLDRVRESQRRLAVDESFKAALGLLDAVEAEIEAYERVADELRQLAASPKSYPIEQLDAASSRLREARDSLRRRGKLVAERASSLPPEMEYPSARARLIGDRIDSLLLRYENIASAVNGERLRRSVPARAAAGLLLRLPKDVAAFGVAFPFGAAPSDSGAQARSLPWKIDARLEGAFPVGSAGLWCRSVASYGVDRTFVDDEAAVLAQGVDVGLFGKGVFGLGFRWEWSRSYGSGTGDPIAAVAVTLGSAGDRLGSRRSVPLWLTTFSYELPPGDGFVFARDINLGIESVLRPSVGLRLEAAASSRVRTSPDEGMIHAAAIAGGVGFRLPPIRPFLWRVSWEGEYRSPLDGGSADLSRGEGTGAFRFGLEYAF